MKTLLAFGIALAALATAPAMAADMRVKAPLKKAPPAPPAFSWTGLYIGGNAGGAWGNFDPTTSTTFVPPGFVLGTSFFAATSVPLVNAAGVQSINPSGFTGGFEAGFNWQMSNVVLGVEGDIESFHLSGNAVTGPVPYNNGFVGTFTITSSASTSWLATARGRVGVAAGNWLFFATGGAAFTNLNGNFAFSETNSNVMEAASFSNTKTGYTVGGGVEAGLWGGWSVKAEYLYVNFGTESGSGTLATAGGGLIGSPAATFPASVLTHSVDLKANIARVGLNYRFGGSGL